MIMAETLVVIAIVAAAAGYVGRKVWRTIASARAAKAGSGPGCGGDCGCSH